MRSAQSHLSQLLWPLLTAPSIIEHRRAWAFSCFSSRACRRPGAASLGSSSGSAWPVKSTGSVLDHFSCAPKLRMHLIVQPARLRNRFQPGLARMSKRDSSRMAAPLGPQCLCLRWPSSEALAQTLALTLTFAHDLERRRTVSLLMLLLQPSICWLLRYYDAFGFACQCSVTKSEK